eukprot:9445858-Pyramimonas_sp.AAC.1
MSIPRNSYHGWWNTMTVDRPGQIGGTPQYRSTTMSTSTGWSQKLDLTWRYCRPMTPWKR